MGRVIKFKSGLKLWVQPTASTRTVVVGIYVRVGSRYESAAESGLSHLIEHMMFKGTEKRTAYELAKELDDLGGISNASTSREYTCFYVSSISENIEKCVELLSDYFFHSKFDEVELEREKKVVCEEIAMYEDDSDDLASENLCSAYYGNNSSARPILGTRKTVKSFTREDILSFIEKHYTAKNIVVSVAGNVKVKDVKALAERYFERELSGKSKGRSCSYKVQEPKFAIKCTVKDFEQSSVALGFPCGIGLSDRRQTLVHGLISMVLGSGMSSKLFQRLREQLGLVYDIDATSYEYSKDSYYVVSFATSTPQVAQACGEVRGVILDFARKGISEEELENAKEKSKISICMSEESTFFKMRVFAKQLLLSKRTETVDETLKIISSITTEEINSEIRRIFDFDKVSVGYAGRKVSEDIFKIIKSGD